MEQGHTSGTGTRVRKRRVSKQRRSATALERFRSPRGGLWVAAGMLLCALAYGAYGVAVANRVAQSYAGLAIGAPRDEVRYLFGAPAAGQEQAASWSFPASGRMMTIDFGADGRLHRIACAMPEGASSSLCPPVYGVVPGASEVDVLAALGQPSSVVQSGSKRIYAYDGLGLRFALARQQVVAIEHGPPARADFARHVLWQLLP